MPYAGLLPSSAAVQQVVQRDLRDAPRDIHAYAIYILLEACRLEGISAAGFEPAISCIQGRRERPDFPMRCNGDPGTT